MPINHRTAISNEELTELARREGERLATILIPTVRAGPETRQNPIYLRNQVDRMLGWFNGARWKNSPLYGNLTDLRERADVAGVWQRPGDGLAGLIDDREARVYCLPIRFEPLTVLGRRFHLAPILATYPHGERFYVVVLSKDELHLMECTPDSWSLIDSDDLPRSEYEAVLQYLEREKSLQYHTAVAVRNERRPQHAAGGTFHGHGGIRDDEKIRVREYFEVVHRALEKVIADYRVPVIFAGVDYLFPIFRNVHSNLRVLEEHIGGNFDEVRADYADVHRNAAEIIENHAAAGVSEKLDLYGNAVTSNRASAEITEIVQAACDGAVETLLIDPADNIWGRFDAEARKVQVLAAGDPSHPKVEDLINLACVFTFRNGGEVISVQRKRMPNRQPAAAIYRFERTAYAR